MKMKPKKILNLFGMSPHAFLIFFSLLLFTVYGCKRELETDKLMPVKEVIANDQQLTEAAKLYFTELADAEKAILAQPTKKLPKNSPLRRNARIAKISDAVDWEAAMSLEENDFSYLLVPIKEELKPFKNKDYEFFRNLIFFRDSSGALSFRIVEVLGKKGTSLGKDFRHISTSSFINYQFGKNHSISNIDAHVMFYNSKYKALDVFELTKGEWHSPKEHFSFRSDMEID